MQSQQSVERAGTTAIDILLETEEELGNFLTQAEPRSLVRRIAESALANVSVWSPEGRFVYGWDHAARLEVA